MFGRMLGMLSKALALVDARVLRRTWVGIASSWIGSLVVTDSPDCCSCCTQSRSIAFEATWWYSNKQQGCTAPEYSSSSMSDSHLGTCWLQGADDTAGTATANEQKPAGCMTALAAFEPLRTGVDIRTLRSS